VAEPALDLLTAGKRRVKAAYLVRLNQHGLAPCGLYSRKFTCVAPLGEARQQVSDVQPFPVISRQVGDDVAAISAVSSLVTPAMVSVPIV